MDQKRKSNRPQLDPPAKPLPGDPDERQALEPEEDKKQWQRNTNAGETDTREQDRGPDQD